MSTTIRAIPTFHRTRLTWQAYLTISYYSYLLNSLGPLTPFLRGELGLSYTLASLHFTAYALGVILTALLLKRAVQSLGARRMVWIGVVGMAAGVLLLMIGRHPLVTISGAFLMGLLGVLISSLLNTALAEQHGDNRAIALTESTMIASLLSALAPVAVGFFAHTALTWRAAPGMMLLAAPALWLAFGKSAFTTGEKGSAVAEEAYGFLETEPDREPAPARPASGSYIKTDQPAALPLRYWLYWLIALLAVAIEFCIIFWAADYLEKVSGMSRANASLGMSSFLGAMVVGRWLVSRLLRRSAEHGLLMISLFTATAGFLLFWLSPGAAAALVGLLVAGLGVAGLFPMINALALSNVPGQMVDGSAKITLAVGLAILLLPLALGRLADGVGIRSAYALVLGLLVLAILLAGWSGWRRIFHKNRWSRNNKGSIKPAIE